MGGTMQEKVRCIPCFNTLVSPTPACMSCEIQIVPLGYANDNPVGAGREPPNALPEPIGRVDWSSAFKDPMGLIKVLMGPKRMVMCTWTCVCLGLTILIVVALGVVYLIVNTVLPILG